MRVSALGLADAPKERVPHATAIDGMPGQVVDDDMATRARHGFRADRQACAAVP